MKQRPSKTDSWASYITETSTGTVISPESFENTDTDAMGVVLLNNRCNEKKGSTMANIVPKNKIKYVDGYLSLDGTLIRPDFVEKYCSLEYFLQRARHEKKQKNEPKPFREESAFADKGLIKIPAPATPVLDKEEKKTDAIAEEKKLLQAKEVVEMLLEEFSPVVDFVLGTNVVLHGWNYGATMIDTPVLGNPLKLTEAKLLELICEAADYPLS